MDRDHKRQQAILINLAKEDPNTFLQQVFESGLTRSDLKELEYLINIARRAKGYDSDQDILRKKNIC